MGPASLLIALSIAACTAGLPSPPVDTAVDDVTVKGVETVVCEDPSLRDKLAFDEIDIGPGWEGQPWGQNIHGQYVGGGLGAADLNGDEVPDIVLPHSDAVQLFMSQPGGGWADEGRARLPDGLPGSGVGASMVDYDADGDIDIYLHTLGRSNALLRNDEGFFTNVAIESGAAGGFEDTNGVAWTDIDDDGDLDLLLAYHNENRELGEALVTGNFDPAQPNELLLNRGDGTFLDASDGLPDDFRTGYSFVMTVDDFDGDGQDDLYTVNDFGPHWQSNQLLCADGDDWQLDGGRSGLDIAVYGMGLGIEDLNDDGASELLISSWGEVVLLESDGGGGWYRSDKARGIVGSEEQLVSWGAEFADVDNDGRMDALFGFGPLFVGDNGEAVEAAIGFGNPDKQPDAIFRQLEDGQFEDVAPEWGVADRAMSRGFAVVDLNRDGWLDLIKRDMAGPSVAYLARCGESRWTRIHLEQSGMNRDAIDAHVTVVAGGRSQTRRVRAGGRNFAIGLGPELHFGLGDADTIERIEIVWPDGDTSIVEDLAVNQDLTIKRR